MTDNTWISVYARSPREGVLLDVKLSDGSIWRGVEIHDPLGGGIWRVLGDYYPCPAWNTLCDSWMVRVTHFRGHE